MRQHHSVKNIRKDLIYPELSFQIVGCAFDVYNEIGYGLSERDYQKAIGIALNKRDLKFNEQVHVPLYFEGELIKNGYCDFIIEQRIIVELKKSPRFSQQHIEQVNRYLRSSNLQLAILIKYTPNGVIFKRLLNLKEGISN